MRHRLCRASIALATVGYSLALLVLHLHTRNHIALYFPSPFLTQLLPWLPPTGALSALLVGWAYALADAYVGRTLSFACFRPTPCKDDADISPRLSSPHPSYHPRRLRYRMHEWSLFLRCAGAFIGLNYAASKLPTPPTVILALSLITLALFYSIDQTLQGLLISLTVAGVGTWTAHVLVLNGYCAFTHPDLGLVRSWLPAVLFASSVCVGSFGRALFGVHPTSSS